MFGSLGELFFNLCDCLHFLVKLQLGFLINAEKEVIFKFVRQLFFPFFTRVEDQTWRNLIFPQTKQLTDLLPSERGCPFWIIVPPLLDND